MQAHEVMTRDVVAVSPDTPVGEVARRLLAHHISAVPVVNGAGAVLGMVSEGDLIGRTDDERRARQDWWLALFAEGEELGPDFVAGLHHPKRTARDIMSAPVIHVGENATLPEIAALLAQYRIKRVPVVRDGKLVGIVSRADLLRGIAGAAAPPQAAPDHVAQARGLLAEALAALDHHFFGHPKDVDRAEGRMHATAPGGLTVGDFRALVSGFERHKLTEAHAAREAAAQRHRDKVKQLIDEHLRDEAWNALLHRAREAAERGEREFLLLRFPSDLCSDRGRAINAGLPDWPQSLRGEAGELYLRWENDLKPRGFHLSARVLDFPGGMPGDVGLYLGWGE